MSETVLRRAMTDLRKAHGIIHEGVAFSFAGSKPFAIAKDAVTTMLMQYYEAERRNADADVAAPQVKNYDLDITNVYEHSSFKSYRVETDLTDREVIRATAAVSLGVNPDRITKVWRTKPNTLPRQWGIRVSND